MDILLAPLADGEATPVGTRWRKQILKSGQLKYGDRTLTFDRPYFESLARAFSESAYDTVPFMLADEKNRHTMAPERANGEIVGLIPTDNGLDAVMQLSEEAVTIVKRNPKFGVSARIVENLARGDGYTAPAALQHVLGTFDPRVTGLSPWTTVDLSNEDTDKIIDLTVTETEEQGMPLTPEQEARLARLLDLPDDKFAALLDGTPAPTELSVDDQRAIELLLSEPPVATITDTGIDLSVRAQLDATQQEVAELRWDKEANLLLSAGVPPVMIDLARPVLTAQAATIELSNGSIDAKDVVRKLLEEAKGTVDLSTERGHQGFVDTDELAELNKAADSAGLA